MPVLGTLPASSDLRGHSDRDLVAAVQDAVSAEPHAELVIHEVQREQAVRDAIQDLSPRCQSMIEMLFFATPPRPYRDVAAQLGLAPGSIGFIRQRCLERLRTAL